MIFRGGYAKTSLDYLLESPQMPRDAQFTVQDVQVPFFLYGTAWKEEATQRCVTQALKAGFRGIDTANQRKHYYEIGVGSALKLAWDSGMIGRTDVFLQTKFTHIDGQDQRLPYDPRADLPTQVMQSFQSSLEHLHTDYLDSYVLHGPSTRSGISDGDWQVWRAMEELQQSGKVKLIGLSNVAIDQVRTIVKHGEVAPAFVQNRCYARQGWDREVREFCASNEIIYQGFSLLTANTWLLRDVRFQQTVRRYGCSPQQLIFAFALRSGMLPLTGTSDSRHMQEDLAAFGFALDDHDIELIDRIGAELD
jgi:diketogulonate reductase-like aldo/keto reductase